jgi:putative acetyltransferase
MLYSRPMELTIDRVHEPGPEVRDLIGELNDTLAAVYEPHQRHGLALEQLFAPHLRFFIARSGGRAVGCGGVALLAGYAEVKRMYTRPAARGQGVAKAVLARLEDEARGSGFPLLRLETGIHQPEAVGLYQRMGFRPCLPFGAYLLLPARDIETSLFFEKPLP